MSIIQNPVLRGFCPDPCMIRSGPDYYLATSTFEWWPGVNFFHSRDLARWEQIESPLRDPGQLDLRGDPNSGGIWAPDLSTDGKRFYLLVTDVKTKKGRWYNTHNYLLWADTMAGPWSQPVYLNSIGFDPSLLHDTDGKCYLVNMVNGFRGVLVQQLDPATGTLVGPRHKVYDGSGIGCTEGPRIYHIGDWYYLLVAEGGTGYEHCVTVARSADVFGPYETMPGNPLLTSDRQDPDGLQKCGHASLVQSADGGWYLAHLCARPNRSKGCILGRETAIQRIVWQDGWPALAQGGRFGHSQFEGPTPAADFVPRTMPERDDFETGSLLPGYASPRAPLGFQDGPAGTPRLAAAVRAGIPQFLAQRFTGGPPPAGSGDDRLHHNGFCAGLPRTAGGPGLLLRQHEFLSAGQNLQRGGPAPAGPSQERHRRDRGLRTAPASA